MSMTLDLRDDRVVVCLSGFSAVMALARQVAVPLTELRSVSVVPDASDLDLGWRVGGTAIPRRLRFGRFRSRRGGRTFAATYCGEPALVLETAGGDWDRVAVMVDDPEGNAERIRAAAGLGG